MFIFSLKSLIDLSRNSVRFKNSSGNWFSDEPNSVRFISQCEIHVWHVCIFWLHFIQAALTRGNSM